MWSWHIKSTLTCWSRRSILGRCDGWTAWSRALLHKLLVPQLLKKFLTFYERWRFITVFTTAHHLSLSWPRWMKFTPYKSQFILLPSILCLGLSSTIFLLVSRTEIQCTFHFSPIHSTCHSHHIAFDLVTLIPFSEKYGSISLSSFHTAFSPKSCK